MSEQVERIELWIPGKLPVSLNQWMLYHHYKRARYVREWQEKVWVHWRAAGCPKIAGRIDLEFVRRWRHPNRPLDNTNLVGSFKSMEDGLRSVGMIRDDDPSTVGTSVYRQEKVGGKSQVGVLVVATAAVSSQGQGGVTCLDHINN